MLALDRPQFAAKEVYLRCIDSVRDGHLKKRLRAVAYRIDRAAEEYATLANEEKLHLVPPSKNVEGIVSQKEMVTIYELRMAREKSPGRSVYDAIKALSAGGVCPFCARGYVSTVDHVLPKSKFCELAVTPDNLVPACRDCNHAKAATAPTGPGDVPVHPYFDDVSGERWLDGQVVEGKVAAVVFKVVPVDAWSDELNERIGRQFDALNLSRVYAMQAAELISYERHNLAQIFDHSGPALVQHKLRCQQHSWEKHSLNCWQAGTLRALCRSDWYCAGGFRGE